MRDEFNCTAQQRGRRKRRRAAAALACIGLLGSAGTASASLIGAQVSYQSLFPNTQTVLNAGGTQTVTPLTTFNDTQNGLTSFFIGNKLVDNTSPLAFATAAFNGPQVSFANGGLIGATVDPTSSTDFIGVLSSTGNSVQTSFQAKTPALGSTMTVDLASNSTLAGQQVGYKYLLPTTASCRRISGHARWGPVPTSSTRRTASRLVFITLAHLFRHPGPLRLRLPLHRQHRRKWAQVRTMRRTPGSSSTSPTSAGRRSTRPTASCRAPTTSASPMAGTTATPPPRRGRCTRGRTKPCTSTWRSRRSPLESRLAATRAERLVQRFPSGRG